MLIYSNESVLYEGCPGCAFANHKFQIPCGIAYQNERFNIAQDFELPIPGFFIVSPNHHVERLNDLTTEERIEMFELINKTTSILKVNNICQNFDYILEEKDGVHLHVWLLPRYEWMKQLVKSPTKNLGVIFEYAKKELRNESCYEEIKRISDIVKKGFEEENK